jgi:phosphodiesterase/alkaline phosphatase D-like protein
LLKLAALLALAALLLLPMGTTAQAATGHPFLESLTEAPPASKLLAPGAVAVDHASGAVFVGDPVAGYVDVFSASGAYESRFGAGTLDAGAIAIDESSGEVYVADPFAEALWAYSPDGKGGYQLQSEWLGKGTPAKEFGEVAGVAVDNSGGPSAGDVYVVEAKGVGGEGGSVDVYRPKPSPAEEGEFLGRLSGPKLELPNGIAVSAASGRVLVADSVKGAIFAYSAEGVFEEKLTGKGSPSGSFKAGEELGNVAALAVDEASGEIYVAEAQRHVVSEYSSSGTWEGWITTTPSGELSQPRGLALDSAGDLYVADAGLGQVERFGPGAVVPDVTTGKVAKASLTRTSAVLAGTINGQGKAAEYRFQYGESQALGSETQTQASGPGEEKAATTVEGLHAGRTYYFRIIGENENGTNAGVIHEFQTPPALEGLATGPVSALKPESATLTGTLTPGGIEAHYYFQWGATTAYGNTTPAPPGTDAGSGAEAVKAEAALSGLTPNSTYHYRLVGENGFGTTFGADQSFSTSGPPQITSQAPTGLTQTEATIHAQVNPDKLATSYRFQWGTTTAYGEETPAGGEAIGSGSVPVAVSAALGGLQIGQSYHYRVIAENEAGTTTAPDQSFTTVASAPVDATYATNIGAGQATLHTLVDPLGNETHIYFQYGTESCKANPAACTNTPLPPGEDIGSGTEDVPGEAHLSGLSPNSTYFYRVIATNGLGTSEGPERTFATQGAPESFSLPDQRAFEMVSPPNKGGAPVEALTREGGVILASEDGDRLTYVVDGALGEEVQGNRSPEWQQVLATRGGSEWSSKDIANPNATAKGITAGLTPEYQFFSSDLSSAFVEPVSQGQNAEPPLAPGVTQATIYLRDNATGTYLPLVTEANTAPGTQFGGHVQFVSATSNLDHEVFSSAVPLTGPTSAPGLYELTEGTLQPISIRPNGKPAKGQIELGYFARVVSHAISEDGTRVIWTLKEENSGRGHLYLRDTLHGRTLQLDAAQGVAEPDIGSAQFQAASSDDSRIFFTDKQRLTADSTAEAGQANGKPDLYECEIVEEAGKLACDLRDLTVDQHTGEHASVQNLILGSGEEGSSLYLIAQGVLAGNQNGNGQAAVAGQNNLYALHSEGDQWTTSFIATLSAEDSPEWEGGTTKSDTAFLTTRVSPNGRYLAFMSAAPLTGYENVDASPAAKGARDEEVFLYDAVSTSLRCVSCNPSGARPNGVFDTVESGEGLGLLADRRKVWAELAHEHWLAGNIPGWTAQTLTSAIFQSRFLSDQGRLYFNSPDSLVPAAQNAKENVYEYEPSGTGGCESSSGGCVSLLSGGSSDHESAFIEATPDGSDVFFVTEAQLLPQDTDTAFDIYDARECSEGSPCLTPPSPPQPPCGQTSSCRPAQPAQSIPAAPGGSATFLGQGNIKAQAPVALKQQVQGSKAGAKPLTRAQRLSRALKGCRKLHPKKKRRACEAHARKLYGARTKAGGSGAGKAHGKTRKSTGAKQAGRNGGGR